MKQTKAAGTRRELQELRHWQKLGYVAFRSPASLGVADIVAFRKVETFDGDYTEAFLIECKANTGSPWKNFGLVDRADLRLAAHLAGATALLVHHPPHGERREYPESEWPEAREAA